MLKCFFFTESAYVFLVTQVAGLELAEVAHPFLNQGDAPTALHKAVNSLRARCAQTMEEIRPTLSHQYIYIYIYFAVRATPEASDIAITQGSY